MASKNANTITGYCMKTKEKGVVIKNCVVDCSTKGARTSYIAKGDDGKGNKMSAIVSEATATSAIAAGTAAKGTGWGKKK